MSERVWYAVDFAKGKGGSKGSGKTKNCTKGKLCGDTCIAKGRNCRIETNATQKKAADALSKTNAEDAAKAKSAVKKEKTGEKAAKQEGKPIESYAGKQNAREAVKKKKGSDEQGPQSYRTSRLYSSDLAEAIDQKDNLPVRSSRDQKRQIAEKILDLAGADLEKEVELKRSSPEKYRIALNASGEKGHDWVDPALVNPPAQMSFNDAARAIMIETGTPRTSTYKITRIGIPPLSSSQYQKYKKKYGQLAKELNDAAGDGDPVNANEQIAQIARVQNVSRSVARERVKAVVRFADVDYPEIRAADDGMTEYKNADGKIIKVSKRAQDDAQKINDYIKDAPKYEGTIYRGLSDRGGNLTEFIDQLKSAEGLTIRSVSSFSSNFKVAEQFAGRRGERNAIIAVKSNRSGSSIRNIAVMPGEDEVLIPKGTRYRYIGERIKDGITIYEVEEI
jgi:hypothetical protein